PQPRAARRTRDPVPIPGRPRRHCRIRRLYYRAPAPPEIYTLSLHDALPISLVGAVPLVSLVLAPAGTRLSNLSPEQIIYCEAGTDRKSTRLNSSHSQTSYAVFCLKKKRWPNRSWCLRIHPHTTPREGALDSCRRSPRRPARSL